MKEHQKDLIYNIMGVIVIWAFIWTCYAYFCNADFASSLMFTVFFIIASIGMMYGPKF